MISSEVGSEEGTIDNQTPENLGGKWRLGRGIRTLPADGPGMRLRRLLRRLRTMDIRKGVDYLRGVRQEWKEKRRLADPSVAKVPLFVLGCNRSGTNMVCAAIGNSPHGWAYREREFSPAFNGYYLRADWIIEWLIRRTPTQVVSFGSILDSQFALDLLTRFDDAKAVWVYRRYEDVANSCARMGWGYHLRNLMRWVAAGELDKLGARGQNVSDSTMSTISELFRENLSDEECAALYWLFRNQLFFDLQLSNDSRVIPIQYEDAALNPGPTFRRLFEFIGAPYDSEIIQDVYAGSVGKHASPKIDPLIREKCDILQERLDEAYERTKVPA